MRKEIYQGDAVGFYRYESFRDFISGKSGEIILDCIKSNHASYGFAIFHLN
ncbi:MAG: hypothetical protein Q7S27_05615 [Nanoarchaeota archaeon]|nr:hypothetical protein [Nanoarchaeota archaeon]